MCLLGSGLKRSAALQPWPSPRPGVQGARAAGPEGGHPACTQRRDDVEEGRGHRSGRALAAPCTAQGAAPQAMPEVRGELLWNAVQPGPVLHFFHVSQSPTGQPVRWPKKVKGSARSAPSDARSASRAAPHRLHRPAPVRDARKIMMSIGEISIATRRCGAGFREFSTRPWTEQG
jgi:hypothetical protein